MSDWMARKAETGDLAIRSLTGGEIAARLDDLARLRIAVFGEYPYLYDGDIAYEAAYLREFAASPGAVMVGAFDRGNLVGAATASPMAAQKENFRKPLEIQWFDTSRLFYFGESVLLPEYRGKGVGHAFFDHREDAARKAGADMASFAAVLRPGDDPARPQDYRPLDEFWAKRGYAPVAGLVAELAWKEHGEAQESVKRLQYWMRRL